jgi:hypothetical protein
VNEEPTMRQAILLATGLAATALVGGCAQGPVAGEIVLMDSTPGHYAVDPQWDGGAHFYDTHGRGWRPGHGAGFAYRASSYEPASHRLGLRQWKYDAKAGRWKSAYSDISVAQGAYAQARPGDWFTYEPAPEMFAATVVFSNALAGYPMGAIKEIPPSLAQEILIARHPVPAARGDKPRG